MPSLLRAAVLSALLTCAGTATAQLAGTYRVDPAGGGTFRTLREATSALFVLGVRGAVEIAIAPGTYSESVVVPPIAGTSPSSPVVFRAAQGPGTVLLSGSTGDTLFLTGSPGLALRNLVFEGLDFVQAPGHAISATSFVEEVEIRDCTFTGEHRSQAAGEWRHALIVCSHAGTEIGWHIHHNRFRLPAHRDRPAVGIYVDNGGGYAIHDNLFDLNDCDHGVWLLNGNRRLDRIWNNVFHGRLAPTTASTANAVTAVRCDSGNYENEIVHNTFAVTIPTTGACLSTSGIAGPIPAMNRIRGNVFLVMASGTAIVAEPGQPVQADENLFWAPQGFVGRLGAGGPGLATLAAWQTATGQDGSSLQVDPQLVRPMAAPLDFHPLPTSPVRDLSRNKPYWLAFDLDGRLRDDLPDAGAFESTSFALYGQGCAGTGGAFPQLGGSGPVALGSPGFSINVGSARPNAIALLFAGSSRTSHGASPLPLPLGGGCYLLASIAWSTARITQADGSAVQPFPIPANPALRGTNVFLQWAIADAASGSPLQLSVSGGGAMQL